MPDMNTKKTEPTAFVYKLDGGIVTGNEYIRFGHRFYRNVVRMTRTEYRQTLIKEGRSEADVAQRLLKLPDAPPGFIRRCSGYDPRR